MKGRIIEPAVEIESLEMADPTFDGGLTKSAKATLTNTTAKQWTYDVELYFGATKVATSGIGQVTIPAGGSVEVTFSLVTPIVEAVYQVFLDVKEHTSQQLLKHYLATETVTIAISPGIDIGSIVWQ